MGSPVARIGDVGVGICCAHNGCISMVGNLITGASTVLAENSQVSRIGDIMLGNCGHIGIMITGSSTVVAEGSPLCRIGDQFSGIFSGVVVSGAATVISG